MYKNFNAKKFDKKQNGKRGQTSTLQQQVPIQIANLNGRMTLLRISTSFPRRFHVVSTWNPCGVFAGLLKAVRNFKTVFGFQNKDFNADKPR